MASQMQLCKDVHATLTSHLIYLLMNTKENENIVAKHWGMKNVEELLKSPLPSLYTCMPNWKRLQIYPQPHYNYVCHNWVDCQAKESTIALC